MLWTGMGSVAFGSLWAAHAPCDVSASQSPNSCLKDVHQGKEFLVWHWNFAKRSKCLQVFRSYSCVNATPSILVERKRFGISPKKMKITGTQILQDRRLSPDGGRRGLYNLLALFTYLPSSCLCWYNSWSLQRADEQMVVTWLGLISSGSSVSGVNIRANIRCFSFQVSILLLSSPLKSEQKKPTRTQNQQTQPHPDISLKPLTPFWLFVE